MDLLERIKAILLRPADEWPKIGQQPGSIGPLFVGYVAILAAIPPIADFLCLGVIGETDINGTTVRMPIFSAVLSALFDYLLSFAVVYVLAHVIDLLAPRFEGVKSFPNALKLAVYSMTPYWLAGIFLLIPGLRFLVMFGLYGAYVLWTGLPELMKSPPERTLGYTAAVVACALAIYLAIVFTGHMLFPFPRP
jgi:Yip1 domain